MIDFIFHMIRDRLGLSEEQMDILCEKCTDEELERTLEDKDDCKDIIEKYLSP